MDNLSTHTGASLYKTLELELELAHALLQKLEFIYTPKHGSWLNMAECEFSVLARQCLDRRIADTTSLTREINAWQSKRNKSDEPVDWRFTAEDARIKLKKHTRNYQMVRLLVLPVQLTAERSLTRWTRGHRHRSRRITPAQS